ncbi:hypothetical protein [Burkholderia sp. Leaf177]|uniref:hypothetical protein n=1 Tax=Burkholderia sp. Leaf177 TaxID=1736287 RepID=UPI000AE95CCF|nr:hypothetical protein [Burkholderia sp. Leaf177]
MISKAKLATVLLAFFSIFASWVKASTLVEFDTPYLFAELVAGKVNGYYGSSLPEVDGRPSTSCEFFFTSDFVNPANPNRNSIKTYYTDSTFNKRARDDVLTAELLVSGERWTLQMDQVPYGCLSPAGEVF